MCPGPRSLGDLGWYFALAGFARRHFLGRSRAPGIVPSMASHVGYTVAEVAQILDLSASRVRGFVRQGLVTAARGPRNEYRFSFQDLVLLRTALGLRDNEVPVRRVRTALAALRTQLPEDRPVSAVHVFAEGHEIVVQDADTKWAPASGQVLFDFDVQDLERKVQALSPSSAPLPPPDPDEDLDAEGWLQVGLELVIDSPGKARDAYRRALECDPRHLEARLNLAQVLHDKGWHDESAAHYELALLLEPDSAVAHFTYGALLEDMSRDGDAADAYRRSIALDSHYRPVYLSFARLLERIGEKQEALQMLDLFKALAGA